MELRCGRHQPAIVTSQPYGSGPIMSVDDYPSEADSLKNSETHLFLLRVWHRPGDAIAEERRWCGKLQEVVSTRGGYFGDLASLVDLLYRMLPGPQSGAGASESEEARRPPTTQSLAPLEENQH